MILSASMCSCRVLQLPPVGIREKEQIILNNMSTFYPGSVDDLYIDLVPQGNETIIFYVEKKVIDKLRIDNEDEEFFSSWHILTEIEEKEGYYACMIDNRYDLLKFSNNRLVEVRTIESVRGMNVRIIENFIQNPKYSLSLFLKKKKKSFLIPNLLLITFLLFLPQLFYYIQIQLEEGYCGELKSFTSRLLIDSQEKTANQERWESYQEEYEELLELKPVDISHFFKDLSLALGKDVTIKSLTLKGDRFQISGEGDNPLGKMESFHYIGKFHSVIPYQVKAINGSERESFSITGVYHDE